MSGRGQFFAGWRTWLLAVALGLRVGLAWAQVPDPRLTRLVRLVPGTRPLGVVLAELSRQSRVPFSYSSSLVPVGQPCHLRPGPPRPLEAVLREVLGAEHLSCGLLAGQLVLWPDRVAAPRGVTVVTGKAAVAAESARQPVATRQALVIPAPPSIAGTGPVKKEIFLNQKASQALLASRAKPPTGNPARKESPRKIARLADPANAAHPATVPVRSSKTRMPDGLAFAGQSQFGLPAKRHRLREDSDKTISSTNRADRMAAAATGGSGVATPGPGRLGRPAGLPAYPRRAPQRPAFQPREAVGLLSPLPALPASAAAPLAVTLPERVVASPGRGPGSQPANSAVPKPADLAASLRGFYLHGEAWGSESLPVGVTAKVGIPRIYLVLGVAAGPADHHAGWAWGAGLGTVGKPRGRFTPSLDLMQWFLPSDEELDTGQGGLTQLRPALAWQLKRGSRWQLLGGPTLNLATAHRDGRSTRWTLGQNQWLWLDSADEPFSTRLWPGVQLGVRF